MIHVALTIASFLFLAILGIAALYVIFWLLLMIPLVQKIVSRLFLWALSHEGD